MRGQSNSVSQYFSLLFSDWLNIVSNAITIASLLIGFLNETSLPLVLTRIPREGYILLAFLAFGVANYRIYMKVKREEGVFDFKITKVEGVGITSEPILYNGQDFSFAPDIKFQVIARLFISNVGAQTAVNFEFISLMPLALNQIQSLEVALAKSGTFKNKEDNPYYFKPDDMSGDFQFRMIFNVNTEYLEKTFGALGKVGLAKLTIGATPTGRKRIERTIDFDFSPAFKHQVEERIPNRVNQNLPATIKAFGLMKRYWLGQEKSD